jgi:type II secretory pathway pseudopilin PulG
VSQPQKTSALAIAALVCAFLCFPLGLILGIVALIRIGNSNGQLGGKGLAIAALVIPLAATPIIGILSAIAIPNFIRYQQRSKQSEAKSVLGGIRTSQQAFKEEYGVYTKIGLNPANAPSSLKSAWDEVPCPETCSKDNVDACASFECIGYRPAGLVYYRYACATGPNNGLACTAYGDLDDDGEPSVFMVVIAGDASAITDPINAEAIAACKDVPAELGRVVDCTPGQF